MRRRDFLMGLAALTGGAFVGVPDIEAQPLALPEPVHDSMAIIDHGQLTGLRPDDYFAEIDGALYALEDASVVAETRPIPIDFGGPWVEYASGPVSWTMNLVLAEMADPYILWTMQPVSLRLWTPYGQFSGEAYVTALAQDSDAWNRVCQHMTLHSTGRIEYSPPV